MKQLTEAELKAIRLAQRTLGVPPSACVEPAGADDLWDEDESDN